MSNEATGLADGGHVNAYKHTRLISFILVSSSIGSSTT